MGGAEAQAGFTYQKDYAAYQLLSSELLRLLETTGVAPIASFVVESRSRNGGSWDFEWSQENGSLHYRECKDTKIKKIDREVFYRRVRKQFENRTIGPQDTIGWATTSLKQGNTLRHFQWIANNSDYDFGDASYDPNLRVASRERAFREAIYFLCEETGSDDDGETPSLLSEKDARKLLGRLKVEVFHSTDLASSVEDLAENVFEHGSGVALRKFIQGEFATEIQTSGEARYERSQFLEKVGGCELSSRLTGVFKEMVRFNGGSSISTPQPIRWDNINQAPSRLWGIEERLPAFNIHQSTLVQGSTGVGKSTFLRQIGKLQAQSKGNLFTLHFDCSAMSVEMVNVLPALCAALSSINSTWIGLDELDQIAEKNFQVWRNCFSRLQQLAQLTILTSLRSEIVDLHDWIQSLASSLGSKIIAPLTIPQVLAEFEAVGLPTPKNKSLLKLLRNPFLFSVFAKTLESSESLFDNDTDVSAFRIIEEFWHRRVNSVSVASRLVGEASKSPICKRSAVSFLGQQTKDGTELMHESENPDAMNGIQMLVREGVVEAFPGSRYRWKHAWFREFALVETIHGIATDDSPCSLANVVCEIEHVYVARDATKGIYKSLLARNTPEYSMSFLDRVFAMRAPLARTLIEDVVLGDPRHVELCSLSPALLIEFLEMATVQDCDHWLPQLSELPDEFYSGEFGGNVLRVVNAYESKVIE